MLPTVMLVVTMDELPQATDVSEAQLPEKSCRRTCDGAEDTVIVSMDDWATKEYHTSFLLVAPQPVSGGVYVDAVNVPPVLIHAAEDVSAIAPLQRLFAGCAKLADEIKISPPKINNVLGGR